MFGSFERNIIRIQEKTENNTIIRMRNGRKRVGSQDAKNEWQI